MIDKSPTPSIDDGLLSINLHRDGSVFVCFEKLNTGGNTIMEMEVRTGLSSAAVVAIVCNTVLAFLILLLFIIIYKACKVPSSPARAPVLTQTEEKKKNEQKYLLIAA